MDKGMTKLPVIISGKASTEALLDVGLRQHMLGIYRNIGVALIISGAIAYAVAATPALSQLIFGTPLKWVAMFAPLAFVVFFTARFDRMSVATARSALWSFSALMGISMASVFIVFTGASIATTVFVAAATFLAMSLWGYTTGTDLSRWSSFLFMGLIGVVLATIVNIFLQSGALQLILSVAGVIVFTGLTAWDTQRAKSDYIAHSGSELAQKLGVMSALALYLNFVNIFQLLLNLTGEREA